ncbi:alpha/beta fold hydrolase [Amycolatopsis rifamycinica]|uniref:Alpha/beta hydrolase n=1 Tax=Amycolatopsis rifamycinica TaxID=287986 RepID=A0A066TQX5_9PSEU|nr:alpha/beta fold hydrolase [Amycolatopsis rifamycinica]KDN17230.1 alpha/beta hydrolase [Amycolatopsis rifamycinica]
MFVHGNPETAAVWDLLLAELAPVRSDLVRLSPPGFGAPLPAGFAATPAGYRDWLAGELAAFGEPVDLVGHDFGGRHVVAVVLSHPHLVRSWVSDALGSFDPGYEWHELARRWQTPGVGEADVAARFGAAAEERTAVLVERGMGRAVAARVAAGQNEEMGRAVLSLYRSAAAGAPGLGVPLDRAALRPGLAILATADHVAGTEEQRRRTAARAGARVAVLEGMGHWWMTHDPAGAAAALTGFWATID